MIRKRLIRPGSPEAGEWLPLEELASVEITSEDPAAPVGAALQGQASGWRAGEPGLQTVRIVFDRPPRCGASGWSSSSWSGRGRRS
jgi:hypothetical protein